MSAAQKVVEDSGMDLSKQEIFKDHLFEPDEDPAGFTNTLIGVSDSHGTEEHYKAFTPDEMKRFDSQIVSTSLDIKDLEDEKAEFVKAINEQLKPLVDSRKKILTDIKAGHVWVTETLYRVVDEQSGMVGVYDGKGALQRIEKLKRGRGLQKTIALKSNLSNNE